MKQKPVTLMGGPYHNNDLFAQARVLKALQESTDIDDIKRIAKMKSRSEVLKTLDKLSIRKSFHEALAKHGLQPDDIVREISLIIATSGNDKVKLAALQGILKSLGLDKYEVTEQSTSTWEDVLLQIHDRERKGIEAPKTGADYDVIHPVVPEEYKHKDDDTDMQKKLYENN